MKTCPQCHLRYPNDSTHCFVDGQALVAMSDPRIGTTLAGRYLIEEVIGEGGMATVYRATHKLIDRSCAVKIMNPQLARDKVVRERFRREAKAAQKLAHPNIIEIFDHGDTDDGTSFLVMELLRGAALVDLTSRGPVPLVRGLPLMIQMTRALARAHDFEVIHRDLKPENIFIATPDDATEIVKLLDFGIARSMQDSRLTGVGEVFGTPQYMAPERITSIDAGPAADLYALGIIFYEMLAGQLPFDAPDIPSFFVKHLKEPPPKISALLPDLPATMESLIERLLAKDPKHRPVDAHRVHADLVAIAKAGGIPVPPDPTSTPTTARPELVLLPPAGAERWEHRTRVFEQMLGTAYGGTVPNEMGLLLGQMRSLVGRIAEMRGGALKEQQKLGTIEERGREGRHRFGIAMDALGLDCSAARDHARAAGEAIPPLEAASANAAAAVSDAHREVITWEGRSGFAEPYTQLADAYRAIASLVDHWMLTKRAERAAIAHRDEKDRVVVDLEFQIRELRAALTKFDQSVEQEKQAQEEAIARLGRQADGLESELIGLSTRFCAPLRPMPQLAELFQVLESASLASGHGQEVDQTRVGVPSRPLVPAEDERSGGLARANG
jgi:serine/threonine-protein kinase